MVIFTNFEDVGLQMDNRTYICLSNVRSVLVFRSTSEPGVSGIKDAGRRFDVPVDLIWAGLMSDVQEQGRDHDRCILVL